MNVILGVTGQVGAALVDNLLEKGLPVKAVMRNKKEADRLKAKGAEVAIADYFDGEALKKAVAGADLLFAITPENPTSNDVLGDNEKLLYNYRMAVRQSSITSLIGLSSIGAQFEEGTGNLLLSHKLENAFSDVEIHKVFIRPAYYYSNWLMSLDAVKENGVLPSFYPPDQKFHMISPVDVAKFVANTIEKGIDTSETIEIVGPKQYSAQDIAKDMGAALQKEVNVAAIPREEWKSTMKNIGFSDDAANNFAAMTAMVAEGKAQPEAKGKNPIVHKTTFEEYLEEVI